MHGNFCVQLHLAHLAGLRGQGLQAVALQLLQTARFLAVDMLAYVTIERCLKLLGLEGHPVLVRTDESPLAASVDRW